MNEFVKMVMDMRTAQIDFKSSANSVQKFQKKLEAERTVDEYLMSHYMNESIKLFTDDKLITP